MGGIRAVVGLHSQPQGLHTLFGVGQGWEKGCRWWVVVCTLVLFWAGAAVTFFVTVMVSIMPVQPWQP
jgi:hypothetical protein